MLPHMLAIMLVNGLSKTLKVNAITAIMAITAKLQITIIQNVSSFMMLKHMHVCSKAVALLVAPSISAINNINISK